MQICGSRPTRTVASALLALVAGCSTPKPIVEKNVTGVDLRITYDARLALDQLQVSGQVGTTTLFANEPVPDAPRALASAGENLSILVDDAYADQVLTLTVDGYAGGIRTVTKSAQVTLVRGTLVPTTVALLVTCLDASGCSSPGACQVLANAQCVLGECQYAPVADGTTRCPLPGDLLGDPHGYCVSGACVGCLTAGDCTTPPGADRDCYDAACAAGNVCTYTAVASRVCRSATCADAVLQNPRTCGADAACADAGTSDCDGYVCNPGGTACLASCSDDSACATGYYCSSPTCVPLVASGELCVGVGNHACASGYCDGTRCCASGDCCGTSATDCPGSYSTAASCTDPSSTTNCQGRRQTAACSDNHVCYSVYVDDDSACAVASHACPNNLLPIDCSDQADQPTPTCPADCSTSGCISGYDCNTSAVPPTCEKSAGLGDACTGSGQGSCINSGYKCDQGICCDVLHTEPCCSTSSQCTNGLLCNPLQFYCYVACTPHTSDQCASSGSYCSNGTTCVAKLTNGVSCGADGDCQLGHCVEGKCCESTCTGMCMSCLNSLTGQGDGNCRAILAGSQDSGQCSSTTASACGLSSGGACACDGAGVCKRANNQSCTTDSVCAKNNCECSNSTCSSHRCSDIPCPNCTYNSNGNNTCEGNISDGRSDGTCGALTCSGQGACHLDVGGVCTSSNQCENNNCTCSTGTCPPDSLTCLAPVCPDYNLGSVLSTSLSDTVASGTTTGAPNELQSNCDNSSAPDLQYQWTAPHAGRFEFAVSSDFDSVFTAIDGTCTGAELVCRDFTGAGDIEWFTLVMSASQTIILVVDGYEGAHGNFSIIIAETPMENAYWDFNESTGTSVWDWSPNENDGTVGGGAIWDQGVYGPALQLDGVDDYVTVPNSASLDISGTGITLSVWLEAGSNSSGDSVILGKPWDPTGMALPWYQYGLEFIGGTSGVGFIYADETNTAHGPFVVPIVSAAVVTDAPWTHVIFTYDGATVKGYVDGVEQLSTASTGSLQARGNPIVMGRDTNNSQWYRGRLDEIRIFNRALSVTELETLP